MDQSRVRFQDQLVELLPRLRRFARTLTHHMPDADDLLQIAVERALLRFGQWRAGTRLDSWMFGIIHHAWIDEVRARQRRDRIMAPEEFGEHVADLASEAPLQRMSLEAAFEQLPDEQREVFVAHELEGHSFKELSEVSGVNINTLLARKRYAVLHLRERLQRIYSEFTNL